MKTTKRNLAVFIFITLACGWFGVLLDRFLDEQSAGDTLGMGLWLITPFIVTILLRIISRDRKDLGLRLNIKKNLPWYGVALLVYPVVTLICFGAAFLFGQAEFPGDHTTLFAVVASSFLLAFLKNIFEETAWRGYLTPKLLELQLNDWFLYAISGLVWALWHLPYYLAFLPDSFFLSTSRVHFVFIATILMLCWNVMYVELYRLSKSIWVCVLMHAVEDALPTLLVIEGYVVFTQHGSLVFDPTTGIIATLLFLAVGFALRKVRKNTDSRKMTADHS